MQDRPTAPELIAAVRDFLARELLPTVTDQRLRFRGLVAANVLAIVERELGAEEALLAEEWARLTAVLGVAAADAPAGLAAQRAAVAALNRQLCARIRAGEADAGAWRAAVLPAVRAGVEAKLRVNNPRYLARFEDGTLGEGQARHG